jgi:hypothetical protein
MLFRVLHRVGVPSDLFYFASLASILASVVTWRVRSEKSSANAERLGIFVGLWAPTFMLIGHGIQELEVRHGLGSPGLEAATRNVTDAAGEVGRRAEAAVKP